MERNRGIHVPGPHLFTRLLLLIATTAVSGWLIIWAIGSFGFSSPITAFLLDWIVVAAMATIALSVHLPLPPQYYEIKACESSGRIYMFLGVPFFKKLVRRGPLSIFSRTFRLPKDKTQADLLPLDQKMKGAEAIHVFSFLAICPLICFSLLWKRPEAAAWLLLFNLLVNAYPIMLQRYNRIRLHEFMTKNDHQTTRA